MSINATTVLPIPSLPLTVCVTEHGKPERLEVIRQPGRECDFSYGVRVHPECFETTRFLHFTCLLNQDGTPWVHGNCYLIDRILSADAPDYKTIESIARDLRLFMNTLANEGIDYLDTPSLKLKMPTYFYKANQRKYIESGKSPNTADRRMGSVTGFYRWLMKQHDYKPTNPLFIESDTYISYQDQHGFIQTKPVTTTDLVSKIRRCPEADDQFIEDGGKLVPLTKEEQHVLLKCLFEINNPEMTLAFLIALTSGARIQTVLTLKVKHLKSANKLKRGLLTIITGDGTGIDTKYGKRIAIKIPDWLVEMLLTYTNSERYLTRKEKLYSSSDQEAYIFITKAGNPYYVAKDDPRSEFIRNPTKGDAVRQFIRQQLQPLINTNADAFKLRFHNLRATFGMNTLEDEMEKNKNHPQGETMAKLAVKALMGHSKLETTERYWAYRSKYAVSVHVQSKFEAHLQEMAQVRALSWYSMTDVSF